MIIGIDGNEVNVEKRVGIGEYGFELLKQFYKIQNSKFKIQNFKLKVKIYLKDKPRADLPKERKGWFYQVIGPKKLWTQFALPFDLFFHRPRPDVFFSPTHYAPRWSSVPTVISIMDLSYIHYPEMFKKSDLYQLKNWTGYSVRAAKRILTISQASKNDIISYYQVKPKKVVVTYPGVKVKTTMQKSKLLETKYGIRGEYVLFVGTLQPRKNLVRLIEAFSLLCHPEQKRRISRDSSATPQNDIQLVVVGKKGWMYEEILAAPKKFGIENQVKFLDYVPDEDLPLFYQNALCFILPSLYEGFGLPVLEAMNNGCPVITSNVSSLPEAGGEAALYVDPENVNDIVAKMKLLIEDKKLRENLIKKGYEQVKKFSWEKTARETLRVLKEVANER